MDYEAATKGCEVHWMIRASGCRPIWAAQPYGTPLKLPLEVLLTRSVLAWFSLTFVGRC